MSAIVFVAVAAITATLTWGTGSIHQHNESRLLNLELRQGASVVSVLIPSIEVPLTSATELANVTRGDPSVFRQYMNGFVGKSSVFLSASLWRVSNGHATPVTSIGLTSPLSTYSAKVTSFIGHAQGAAPFAVLNQLGDSPPSIGYAAALGKSVPWVIFADTVLPSDKRLNIAPSSFSQLRYAMYLGKSPKPSNLLFASPGPLPSGPNEATTTVSFGSDTITLVATAIGELGGNLLARLPWIIAIVGGALSLLAALITEYLIRRRRAAERLASENRRLYREQRGIAETLQHALLPRTLPEILGVETAARYVAGGDEMEVGGDWYDVIPIDDTRFVFVVGDVSGHGIEAATIMARLHFAIRAYAVQGDTPETILHKLGKLLDLERDRSFATVLCGTVDVTNHAVTVVNAGHPPPLVLNGTDGSFLQTTVFPPVGISSPAEYRSMTFDLPAKSTILAFTDGLVERRGETLDTGLDRLRSLTLERPLVLDDLLNKLVVDMRDGGYSDDMAILAVRWQS